MEIKAGDKITINDSILGEIIINVKEVLGDIISFENKILNYSGMCHVSNFEKMIIQFG